jgi:hypothetical protein
MNHDMIVRQLLIPAWSGIPAEYKSKYARNIWEQFEAQIRSAAYTSNLPRFFESLSTALAIEIRRDDLAACHGLLSCGEDRAALKLLRDETTTLVLMVRLENEERREKIKQRKEMEKELDRPLAPGESMLYTEEEMRQLEAMG